MQQRKPDLETQNKNSFVSFLKTAVIGAGLLFGALAVFFIAGMPAAQAQGTEPYQILNNANLVIQTDRDIRDIVASFIKGLMGLLGLIAVILVLYGGWLYMTSRGQPEQIDRAKKVMINAGIGLFIIISAYSILAFFLSLFGIGAAPSAGSFRGRGGEVGGLGGALGNGPIQSHFPPRDAKEIPRNTSILVTFKEEMNPTTLINDTNGDGIYGNCVLDNCDKVNSSTDGSHMADTNGNSLTGGKTGDCIINPGTDAASTADDTLNCDRDPRGTNSAALAANVLIMLRSDFDQNLFEAANILSDVKAETVDNKTFVFKPMDWLGNADNPEGYVVILGAGIYKMNGNPAFTIGNPPSYAWPFEVSTKIDIDPPTVTSVIPNFENPPATGAPVGTPRNSIVQINFSEAVNPITVSGTNPNGIWVEDLTRFSIKAISNLSAGDNIKLKDGGVETETTYTFRSGLVGGCHDNSVLIGGTSADSMANLAAAINLSAGAGTAYCSDILPSQVDGNSVLVGDITYTFKSTLVGCAAKAVLIGANPSDTLDNLFSAVNKSSGSGVKYCANPPENIRIRADKLSADPVITVSPRPLQTLSEPVISPDPEALNRLSLSRPRLTGKFEIANQYRTVEFTTDIECGINSCGEKVYCLPGESKIQVFLKSAGLVTPIDANQPFLAQSPSSSATLSAGIADIADNALDGNSNKTPQGNFDCSTAPCVLTNKIYNLNTPIPAQGDNYRWAFFTNNEVDLVPPTILSYAPTAKAVAVNPSQQLTATFDKYISAATVKPDSGYGDGFCGCTLSDNSECNSGETCNTIKGYCENGDTKVTCYGYQDVSGLGVGECKPAASFTSGNDDDINRCTEKEHITLEQATGEDAVAYWMTVANNIVPTVKQSTTTMDHVTLLEDLEYGAKYGSGIKDLFQNCYIPSGGPGCPVIGGGLCSLTSPCPGVTTCQANGKCTLAAGGEWVAGYPSCDLTQSTMASQGVFNLTYLNSTGGNGLTEGMGFGWDQTINQIYKLAFEDTAVPSTGDSQIGDISYFKDFLSPNTVSMMIYNYDNDPSDVSPGIYYLVGIGSGIDDTTGNSYEFELSSPDPMISFTNTKLVDRTSGSPVDIANTGLVNLTNGTIPAHNAADVAITDVVGTEFTIIDGVKATVLANGKLRIKLEWAAGETSGFAYALGSSDNFSFKMLPQNVLTGSPALRFVYRGGAVTMPNNLGFDLLTLDRTDPLATGANFTAAYNVTPDNYTISVKWDASPATSATVGDNQTDISQAYFELEFPTIVDVDRQALYNLNDQALYDDGTNGDEVANDNIWTYNFDMPLSSVTTSEMEAAHATLNENTKDYSGNKLDATVPVIVPVTVE